MENAERIDLAVTNKFHQVGQFTNTEACLIIMDWLLLGILLSQAKSRQEEERASGQEPKSRGRHLVRVQVSAVLQKWLFANVCLGRQQAVANLPVSLLPTGKTLVELQASGFSLNKPLIVARHLGSEPMNWKLSLFLSCYLSNE